MTCQNGVEDTSGWVGGIRDELFERACVPVPGELASAYEWWFLTDGRSSPVAVHFPTGTADGPDSPPVDLEARGAAAQLVATVRGSL